MLGEAIPRSCLRVVRVMGRRMSLPEISRALRYFAGLILTASQRSCG